MITPFLFVLVAYLCACKPSLTGFYENYISRERTCLINGFFIWFVFISHIYNQGVILTDIDKFVVAGIRDLKQLMVSTFFLFSGYGIMHSLLRKGKNYAAGLISKRFFALLLHYSFVVLVYVAVQFYILGNAYSVAHVLSAFAAWSSVGVPTWFIFVTLLSYWFIAISYHVWHRIHPVMVVLSVALMFVILIPLVMTRGYFWADSCLCMPVGMLYRLYQSQIEKAVKSIQLPVCCMGAIVLVVGFIVYRKLLNYDWVINVIGSPSLLFKVYVQNLGCIIFGLGTLWLFAGIRFRRTPKFLVWSGGSALFYLYVFHQLPMLLGKHWLSNTESPLIYQAMCIIVTIVLAWAACRIFARLDALIWIEKQPTTAHVNISGTGDARSALPLAVKLGIIVVGMLCCLSGTYRLWIPRGVEVEFMYAADKSVNFQVFYLVKPKHKWLHADKKNGEGVGKITFFLPTKELRGVRLDVGDKQGNVEISDLHVIGKEKINLIAPGAFASTNVDRLVYTEHTCLIESCHKDSSIVYTRPLHMRAGANRQFQPVLFIMILCVATAFGFMLTDLCGYIFQNSNRNVS